MNNRLLFIASHFYPNGSIVEAKNNYLSVLELERYGFKVHVAAPIDVQAYPANVKYLIKYKSRTSLKAQLVRHLRKAIKIPLMPIRFDDASSIIVGLQNEDLNNYDYIYTVFGNGSEHIAGLKLKEKCPHIKWIAEFRDPWAHNKLIKKYLYDHSFSWYAKYQWNKLIKAEARVLGSVDMLLVESSYHGELIKRDFGYTKETHVCNGYSDRFMADIPTLDIDFPRKPVIGFIGSTYYGYDETAEIFVRVLEELESEGVDFTFVSVGDSAFSTLALTSSSKNFYAFHKVSYLKSQAFISKLTYGLAMTMENYPNHVNSKIFEYMHFKKPTLAIAPEGGAMDEILKSADAGSIVSYHKDEMKDQLRKILQHSSQVDTVLRSDRMKAFDRKEVFKEIVREIRELE
jgi:glycosyltransferase involved in cell wall biosynthesis